MKGSGKQVKKGSRGKQVEKAVQNGKQVKKGSLKNGKHGEKGKQAKNGKQVKKGKQAKNGKQDKKGSMEKKPAAAGAIMYVHRTSNGTQVMSSQEFYDLVRQGLAGKSAMPDYGP